MIKDMKNIILIILGIAIILILALVVLNRNSVPPKFNDGVATEESAEFTSKIQNFVVQNIGQPIEGFSAEIYLQAFHGLTEQDFNGVETIEGEYIYSNGKLTFTRKQTKYISSAEHAIMGKGHATLLNNLRARLGKDFSVDEIVSRMTLDTGIR